jgi:hypothetical protein
MDKEYTSKSPINPRHINDPATNFQIKQFNHSPQTTEKNQQTTPKTMNTFSSQQQQHQQLQQQFISNLKQVKNKPSAVSNANSSPPKSTIYINNSSLSVNNLNSGEDINTLPSVQERIEQFQQISNQRQHQRSNAFNVGNLNSSNQSLISNNSASLTNTPTSSNNSNNNKLFNRTCNNTPLLNSQNTFNNNNNINSSLANTNGISEQKESSPKTIKLTNSVLSSSNDNLNTLNNYNNSNGETTLVRQNIQSHNSALNRLNILQQQQLTYNNNLKEIPSSVASPTSLSSPQANLKTIRQVTINSTNGNTSNCTVLETVLKGKLITFQFLKYFIENGYKRKAYGKLMLSEANTV